MIPVLGFRFDVSRFAFDVSLIPVLVLCELFRLIIFYISLIFSKFDYICKAVDQLNNILLMKILQTIEEAHRRFETTGSGPLLVTCNDFQDWVCKYHPFSANLFKEYIGSEFAKIWKIKTPDTCFIQVKEEHISLDKFSGLQLAWFRKECFGSNYLKGAEMINNSMNTMFQDKYFRTKIKDKTDFLKIALFDIWIGNEDRNHNNYNLLLDTSEKYYHFFYVIDHETIFNTSLLERGIVELTEDETILNTDIAKLLFSKQKKISQIVDDIVINFYLCTQECECRLKDILDQTPISWNIDKEEFKSKIGQHIFSAEWKKKCEVLFRQYVQSFIIN